MIGLTKRRPGRVPLKGWIDEAGARHVGAMLLAILVVVSFTLVPSWAAPAVASGVTGNADVPLVKFLDLGSCLDPNWGVTAAGVGLFQFTASGNITINLPSGATPDGAYVFWNGADSSDASGDPVVTWTDPSLGTSQLAPDQTYGGALWEPQAPAFPNIHFAWSFRTAVSYSGSGTYTIADVGTTPGGTFDTYNNGAGMLALYRDPSLGARRIQAAHGLDMMQSTGLPSSGPGSEKLVFEFDPEPQDRTAQIISIVGGEFTGQQNALWYITGSGLVTATVPSGTDLYSVPGATALGNPFQATDGLRWDTFETNITVPADDEWIVFQLQSIPSDPSDPTTAPRLEWIAQTFSLPLDCPDLGNQTFIDWNNNGVYEPATDVPFPDDITVTLQGSEMGFSDSATATGGLDQGAPGDSDGGNYLFADLPAPATYTATVPGQSGYTPTTSLQQTRTLTYPGPDVFDVDFGFLPDPGIEIVKLAGDAPDGTNLVLTGPDVVTYTYIVTNTGLTYLTPVTVTDDILGQICVESGPLAPGASFTCTASVLVSTSTANIGTAIGTPSGPDGTPIPPGVVPVTPPSANDDAVVVIGNARLMLSPSQAANQVGSDHVLTATLELDHGDGNGFVPAPAGETITATLDSGPGSLSGLPCTTDSNGQCSLTLTSSSTGLSQLTASWSGTITTTQGSMPGSASDSAVKRWVDARLTLSPPQATNEVGSDHVLTATLELDYGDGNGFVAAPAGESIAVSITSGPGSLSGSPCTTSASGQCTVTLTSSSTGLTQLSASWSGTIVTAEGSASASAGDSAEKLWVDARIRLSPLEATNPVNEPHTITVTVEQDTGSGWVPAPDGTQVDFSFTLNTAGATFVSGNSCTTVGGSCTVTINASSSGDVSVHATTSFTVSGILLTRETDGSGSNSADANKTYVQPGIVLVKLAGTAPDGAIYYISGSQTVTYTYIVTNTGDTYLSDITIADDNGTPGNPADDFTITSAQCSGLAGPLAPGGSVSCTYSKLVGADETNTATATGSPTDDQGTPLGLPPVQDDDDAVVMLLGSLGDFVWEDMDGDGIQSPQEPGIPNVLVCLYNDVDGNGKLTTGDTPVNGAGDTGAFNHCRMTDSGGSYLFVNLPPGDYVVDVDDSNFQDGQPLFQCGATLPFQGSDPLLDSNGAQDTFDAGWTLASGDNYLGVDFGFNCQPKPVQLVAGETYARELNGVVQIHWATSNEANILGFNILRGSLPDLRLAQRINAQVIPSRGGFGETFYRFDDTTVSPDAGYYLYWIEVLEADGSTSHPAPPLKVVLSHQRTVFMPFAVR